MYSGGPQPPPQQVNPAMMSQEAKQVFSHASSVALVIQSASYRQ